MSNVVISCDPNITETRIHKFISLLTKNTIFTLCSADGDVFDNNLSKFENTLRYAPLDKEGTISFIGYNGKDCIELRIGLKSLMWWRVKNERWLKLFPHDNENINSSENVSSDASEVISKQTKTALAYCVAIANLEDGKLTTIKSCVDTKKNVIEFLNNEIAERVLTSFMKTDVVINLCYDDANNKDLWFTAKELEEMGLVELK